MPCFKGIAVSIHAEGAPLPEYSMQRHTRLSRVNTYVPVPAPKFPGNSETGRSEQSKFAISITLLIPGSNVPYSTPRPTAANPYPQPQQVGGLPSSNGERGNYRGSVAPYHPLTNSDNETIAAYIYFDGRAKEEVATLLRPGEETWVNSRWVQVSDSEGGGLAEREFLFREVGLERWLNGLDLDASQDAAAKLEKRRLKMEKRRIRRKDKESIDALAGMMAESSRSLDPTPDVLRYGGNESAPVEKMSDDEGDLSGSDSDDEPPESAGQIKVCMFRVLASGEIKKGEYSPQFDAHDDDDVEGSGEGANGKSEADHTTSFAPPKELDPKSISTQTVTGIDGPEKPYATFTFMYRGERTLRKMGVLNDNKATSTSTKRKSTQIDFGKIGPLKPGGTVGFQSFRDNEGKPKPRKQSNGKAPGANLMDESDDEDDDFQIVGKMEEELDEREPTSVSAPGDAQFSGQLADGVRQIKLKRQHSLEDVNPSPALKSPTLATSPGVPTINFSTSAPSNLQLPNKVFGLPNMADDTAASSPYKKHRPSTYDDEVSKPELAAALPDSNVLGSVETSRSGSLFTAGETQNNSAGKMDEEEL